MEEIHDENVVMKCAKELWLIIYDYLNVHMKHMELIKLVRTLLSLADGSNTKTKYVPLSIYIF